MNQRKEQSNTTTGVPASKMCGCCGLHTQGDKDMAEFLADEIKMEEASNQMKGQLPEVKGFSVLETNEAEVSLRKSADGETVTIRFNVNHSIDDESMGSEGPEDTQAELVSRPAFTVEINKGGSRTLAIHCQFPQNDPMESSQQDYEDSIEISEITILDNNSGEWQDSKYVMGGAVMDGNLYDMLLKMMEERGVTADTIDGLCDFATQYDHNQYVSLLKAVKDFVLEK